MQDTATFAGGCFWCLEAAFQRLPGVLKVESGYCGGQAEWPTYQQVCRGDTGHAEAVRITFDPQQVSYDRLLDVFFLVHDPTTPDRQGHDVGTQYRSAIFFHDPGQQQAALAKITSLNTGHAFAHPVVTETVPAGPFWVAEAHHQNYYFSHEEAAYCQVVIRPKLERLSDTGVLPPADPA